jgi:mercuric ion transport protein
MANTKRARNLSLGGAVLASLAAASCCVGPLLLAVLGLGGASALAVLSDYRPAILGVTTVLLGAGFYLTYAKPRKDREGETCGCDRPRHPPSRLGLWLATVMVVALVALPTAIGATASTTPPNRSSATTESAVIAVRGADCAACAAGMKRALASVGGLHDLRLDFERERLEVEFEPAPGRLEAYVGALNELGYEATLPPAP